MRNKKRSGFTLVEILITVVTIGIVAALIIPKLIMNYQKYVIVNKLKKSYTILTQAVTFSEVDNGPITSWNNNLTKLEFFEIYLYPYLKITNSTTFSNLKIDYTRLNGSKENTFTLVTSSAKVLTLSDGTLLYISNGEPYTYSGIAIGIDINGTKNQM